MRISLARYALVALTALILAGCQGGGGYSYMPRWSLSSLNPFKKSPSDAPAYPPRPSSLASPTPTMPSNPGYAAANSGTTRPTGLYPGTPASYDRSSRPSGYGSPGYGAGQTGPRADYGTPGGTASNSPSYLTPQHGYYDPGAGYASPNGANSRGADSAYSSTPYNSTPFSSNSNPNSLGSPDDSSYRFANRDAPAGNTSRPSYESTPGAAPRYATGSDRYGSGGTSAPSGDNSSGLGGTGNRYPTGPDSQYSNSGYANRSESPSAPAGANTGPSWNSALGSRYDWGADSDADRSSSGGSQAFGPRDDNSSGYPDNPPYGSTQADPSDRYSSFTNDPTGAGSSSQVGDRYADRGTGASESGSRYDRFTPGKTGYTPPNIPPYEPPGGSYTPPGSTTEDYMPYRPGSVKTYTPRSTVVSNPSGTFPNRSTTAPTADPNVSPARYELPVLGRG